MPLVGRLGETEQQASIAKQTEQVVATVQSVLDHQPYIKDTFVNRTAFNPITYAEEFRLLQQWTRGSRIEVTYFNISKPTAGNQRADAIDPSRQRSPIDDSYTQINKMVIGMQDGGLHSTFDPDTSETRLTGVALVLPGFQPRNGDMFVTSIGDAKFGAFQVVDVDRLTYRQGSNHKITFVLREFASDENIADIKSRVTKEVFFDTMTYLGDATTLLSAESYYWLQTLRKMRPILIRYYYNTFYDRSMSSIIGPTKIYDPYLVHYLTTKISIAESTWRPLQLYPPFENYENSLWSRLSEMGNRRMTNIQSSWNLVKYRATRWDIGITTLVNHDLIQLESPSRSAMLIANEGTYAPDDTYLYPPVGPSLVTGDYYPMIPPLTYISTTPGYVLSSNFYSGNRGSMTPFEVLVWSTIRDRKVYEIGDFIESYLNQYASLTADEAYYFIPLYLWLIDTILDQISAPSSFMT